ncbi:MAG: MBG domain-containing protein [Bacteroidota bacterium]
MSCFLRILVPTILVWCLFFSIPQHARSQANGSDFSQTSTLTGLVNPWDINFGPDGYLWWTECKNYKLYRTDISAGTPTKQEVFDFSASRLFASNQTPFPQGGLMGFAFHPDFASKPYIYVAYVYRFDGCLANNAGCFFRNRIERYSYNATSSPKLTNPVVMIDLAGSSDHNGGRMSVGPDNKLYYCQSDMGAGQFTNTNRTHNSQDAAILEGKVLRLNMDPDAAETGGDEWIPNDNPYTNAGKRTAVYTLGHRNHQGIVWANVNGTNRLYQTEHGPQSDDELNLIESATNYGYPRVSGFADGNYNNIDNGPYTCGPLNLNPTEQANAISLGVKEPISTLGTTVASPNNNPESSNSTWPSVAPAGIDYYGVYPNGPVLGWTNSVMVATLKNSSRNPSVQRISLSADGATAANLYDYWTNNVRYRDVAIAPNGRDIYVIQDAASANLYRFRYNTASNAGFFAQGGGLIKYSIDGGADINSYSNNANLGFPASLVLKGGVIHTTKTGSGNICSASMSYRVYKQGTTPGAFSSMSGFVNDASSSFTTTAVPANVTGSAAGHQRWSKSDAAVDLMAIATTPGVWVMEVFYDATGRSASTPGCADGFRLSNGGYNYRYYFNVGPLPVTASIAPLTAITYGSGSAVNLTATLSSEFPITGTVNFTIDGNSVGSAAINAAGVATLSYIPNNLTAAGSPHSVVASFTATGYTPVSASTNWTVNKKVLTVTADAKSKVYNGAVFSPFTSTFSGFVNSETSAVVTGTVNYSGSAVAAVNASNYTITPVVSGLSASNYSFTAVNGTLQITKVALAVTADNKSKSYNGSVFSPFTYTISGFVNSENSGVVGGTVTYAGTAVAAINSGTYTITPVTTGLSATNYSFTAVNGNLQINKVVLTVTADNKSKTYNGAVFSPFTRTFTGFVNSESSSVVTGTVTYTGTAVAAINSGSYTITPVITGLTATNYSFSPANGSLQVNKAVLNVTANNQNKPYDGTGFSSFTFSYSGFVNSENSSVVSGTVTYAGTAIGAVNAGSYTITPVVAGLTAANYSFSPVNGSLQINKAILTVIAENKSKTYNGSPFSPFTYTVTGFVNSENSSTISGTVSYIGTSINAVNAGSYPITPITTGLVATNYSFAVVNGILSISKASLVVTAEDKNKPYDGLVYASFTSTFTGFVNGENETVVTGSVSYGGSAATAINAGSYSIFPIVSGLAATNYDFTTGNGTLSIDRVGLTVTADDITVNFEDDVPTLLYTVSGFVNNEDVSVLIGMPVLSTTYTNTTPVAASPVSIDINPGTLSAANYIFNFQNGQVFISPIVYYNITGTNVSNLESWGANPDGTGVHPQNFTTAKYIFNLTSGYNTMSADVHISGTLHLGGGIVFLGDYNLSCTHFTGGGAWSYIITNGIGKLKIANIGTGGIVGDVLFPVGGFGGYSPVILNNSGSADEFGVRVQDGFNGAGPVSYPDKAVNLLWDISEAVIGGSNAAVTLQWNGPGHGTDFNINGSHEMGHYIGGVWVASPTMINGSGPYSAMASGFTNFSPFAVGMTGAFATVSLNVKLLLQGALIGNGFPDEAIMRDDLRSSPSPGSPRYIPNIDPYANDAAYAGIFTPLGDGANAFWQTVQAPVSQFADNGHLSAVDWIFIELRSKTDPANILATRSAILRRDGSVVDIDGNSCVRFPTLLPDDYYVAVRHRNHLGAMTATALPASTFSCGALVDFTSMTNADLWNHPGFDGLEMATLNGNVRALWAGNASGDGKVKYQGGNNDRTLIQSDVINFPANTALNINYDLAFGYLRGDVNMDSKAKYQGGGNDRTILQSLVLGYLLNSTLNINYDLFLEQLP